MVESAAGADHGQRRGRCHDDQIRRREAARQAQHDPVVLAPLASGADRPAAGGVRRVDAPEQATTALVFADDAASLRDLLATHQERLARPEVLWVAYPKGNRTDINRDSLWPILGELGLRPVTQVAIDQVWSALRFRPLKPGEAPFTGGRS
jgi:hypothetical protein